MEKWTQNKLNGPLPVDFTPARFDTIANLQLSNYFRPRCARTVLRFN